VDFPLFECVSRLDFAARHFRDALPQWAFMA
jgi:hypothetical protein